MKKTVMENLNKASHCLLEAGLQTVLKTFIHIAILLILAVEYIEPHSDLRQSISLLRSWL